MNTLIELSEAERAKIKQNEQEELMFRKNLHSLINGDKKLTSRPLVVGKTPNIFAVCDKSISIDNDLVITKKVIEKCMRPELRDENGKLTGKTGHGLTEELLKDTISSIKAPVMILKGSKDNSFVAVTDLIDNKNREMVVTVEFNKVGSVGNINNITSAYGRTNFNEYLEHQIKNGNVVAINKEKVDKLPLSIEKWYLKANTVINYDNSIAYSTANVKYISENSQNISVGLQ